MQEIIDNIAAYFTGDSNEPANPDIAHNIFLLEETKKKIETGVFTRFFKKPVIMTGELITYLLTIILIGVGIYFWSKVDSLIGVVQAYVTVHNLFADAKWDGTIVSIIDVLLLVVSIMPAFICFLLGRSLSKSRKQINTFRQVENMIDRVVYNLKSKKVV
ncbi:hypothetical protein [Ferruginibacter profundus]